MVVSCTPDCLGTAGIDGAVGSCGPDARLGCCMCSDVVGSAVMGSCLVPCLAMAGCGGRALHAVGVAVSD